MKKALFNSITVSILFLVFCLSGCKKEEPVKACFSYQQHQDTAFWVQFQNCSENATSYLWELNDGTDIKTSTQEHPKFKVLNFSTPIEVTLTAINGNDSDVLTDRIYDWNVVYKPNIYLYPTQNESLCVELQFPLGGEVTASEPLYQSKWCVYVTPEGLIENQYRFLFYESTQPNIWQQSKGYCISQNNLKMWFETELTRLNFSKPEIADFIEYWIPVLDKHPYYLVYPQTNSIIDRVIKVNISKQPDVFYRIYYGFKGIEAPVQVQAPAIEPMERNGFVAVEWGGFVL